MQISKKKKFFEIMKKFLLKGRLSCNKKFYTHGTKKSKGKEGSAKAKAPHVVSIPPDEHRGDFHFI